VACLLAGPLGEVGLASPVGHCVSVALGGYLLAGGLGWGMRMWDPACHSVEGIDVVAADGEVVHADKTHNPELFWAARGAGPGFFGVVTRFHLRAYPRPVVILNSTYVYPLAEVEAVSHWAFQLAITLPDTVELLVMLGSAPPGASARPAGKVVGVIRTVFADDHDEATAALAARNLPLAAERPFSSTEPAELVRRPPGHPRSPPPRRAPRPPAAPRLRVPRHRPTATKWARSS